MKKILDFLLIMAIAVLAIFYSCKKEYSCEGLYNCNKPPIAIAGPDQVITLPTDSVLLDDRNSRDPDGTISEWLWTKISGPASFAIIKPTDSTTVAKTRVLNIKFCKQILVCGAGKSKIYSLNWTPAKIW